MRILAVGAHPDDIECCCAGTLAKYVARGDQVFAAVCTNGELGSVVIAPADLPPIREAEAREGAALYGAELWWMGEPDGFLWFNADTWRTMRDIFDWAQPDVIFSHGPEGYHSDHRTASELVRAVWGERRPLTGGGPALFYMDAEAGVDFVPSLYVDITETIDIKLGALACHRSQLDWILAHDGLDLVDKRRVGTHVRGQECGAEYAECFCPALPDEGADLLP